jgi:DNA-binding transcriptional ArsR family regulator
MDAFRQSAALLKVMAHPERLRLLAALREGEACVCHLTARLGQRQPYVSQQRSYWRDAGLSRDRQEGLRERHAKRVRRACSGLHCAPDGNERSIAVKIKILGPSCANCLRLEMLVMETLEELGIREATVEKVAVERDMEQYLTGEPPGLVINEELVWAGGKGLPTKAQIAEWIREATAVRSSQGLS